MSTKLSSTFARNLIIQLPFQSKILWDEEILHHLGCLNLWILDDFGINHLSTGVGFLPSEVVHEFSTETRTLALEELEEWKQSTRVMGRTGQVGG